MGRLIAILAIILSPAVAVAGGIGQGPPLLASRISQKGSTLTFDITNVSQKEIRADVIACSLTSPEGQKLAATGQRIEIAGLPSISPAHRPFKPGATRQGEIKGIPRNESGQYARCQISVDYVLFADGSSWGPDSTKEAGWIAGFINGYDRQALMLQSALRKGKDDAVLTYVKDFKPVPWFRAPTSK